MALGFPLWLGGHALRWTSRWGVFVFSVRLLTPLTPLTFLENFTNVVSGNVHRGIDTDINR